MKHILTIGTVLLSAVTFSAAAESFLDSFHGNSSRTNDVASALTRTETRDVSLMAEQTMIKTGGGELVLPEAVQSTGSRLNVTVAEGTLTMVDDASASPAVDLPAALRAKAQLWLSVRDANAAHLEQEVSGDGIEKWYDVRETNVGAPTYGYAVSEHWNGAGGPRLGTAEYVTLWNTVTNKLYSLNFGGYGSGCAMLLKKPDGAEMTEQPWECFAVQGVVNSFGNIFGEASEYPSEIGMQLNIKEHTAAATLNHGLGGWASCWGPSKGNAAGWIDGVRVDQGIPIQCGFHLLDYRRNDYRCSDYYNTRVPIALYSSYSKGDEWTDNSTMTKGGDYLSELLYFTNALTHVERAQVTAYLMTKWFGKASVPKDVWIAAGATLKADVPAGSAADLDVQARGAGAFVKTGAGTLLLKSSKADAFQEAEIDLQAGEIAQSGTAPFKAASGERLTASTLPDPENAGPYGTNAVVRANDAGTGRFVKDGNAAIAVASVPADVTTVSIAGGELAFRPGSDARSAFVRKEVYIPNHGFEEWHSGFDTPDMAAINLGWYPDSTSFLKQWAVHGGTAYVYDYYRWTDLGYASHMSNLSIQTYELDKLPPRNGTRMVMLLGSDDDACKFYTSVTIDEAGEYELSADICGRRSSKNGFIEARLENEDGSAVQEIGKFTYILNDFMTRQAVRTMIAAPGTYLLAFRARSGTSLCLDDVHLAKVGPYSGAYKIPYGDFEGSMLNNVNTQPDMDGRNLPGWTFDGTTVDGYPAVGIVNPECLTLAGHLSGNGYNGSREPLGGQYQLLIRRAPSTASVVCTPPAGRWYLAAAVGNWRETKLGRLTATATVGGQVVSLGTLEQDPRGLRMMYDKTWPVPFEADGNEVTIALSYALSSGETTTEGVHIDDVRLVAAYSDDRELLTNSDFEKDEVNYIRGSVGGAQFRYYGRDDETAFGKEHGKGSCFCELSGNSGFYFDANLPHAGWYDLSFSAKSRMGCTVNAAPVSISVVCGGVTNHLHTFSDSIFSRGVFSRYRIGFGAEAVGPCRIVVVGAAPSNNEATDLDDFSLKFIGKGEGFEMSEDTEIEVANGTKLVLDFKGTKRVKAVRVNGREKHGVIGPEKDAAFSGEGRLFVEPVGLSIIVR